MADTLQAPITLEACRRVPLGDQGVLTYFADEQAAWRFAAGVRALNAPWLEDVVQAYTTVAVFFDPDADLARVTRDLEAIEHHLQQGAPGVKPRRHEIPCCYELGPDLSRVAQHTGLSHEAIIALHAGCDYTVYAIGFCPGFPYLGYLPAELCAVPRLETPRLRVESGSVGLTGRQTGIYTEPRPGGWNLVGRTPLELVNVADNYFPLQTGDSVRFVRIDITEFQKLKSKRLASAPPRSPEARG